MNRLLTILSIIVLTTHLSVGNANEDSLVNTSLDNVYLLQVLEDSKEIEGEPLLNGSGSGFAISPKFLVTNNHVAIIGDIIKVFTHKGEFIGDMKIVITSAEFDTSILEFVNKNTRFATYLPLSLKKLNMLDELYAVGYPLGDGLIISKGSYQDYSKNMTKYNRMIATITPGMSGGPVLKYNENSGVYEVVGITTAYMGTDELKVFTLTLFVDASNITDLLYLVKFNK